METPSGTPVQDEESGTGDYAEPRTHVLSYPFGPYRVTVELAADGRFVSIRAIELEREFLSVRQRSQLPTYEDVEEFYRG